ncbi:hypothetical protein CJ207_27010, partial [Klebsiella aerogenes]
QLNGLCGRFRGFYPVVIDVETAGFNAKTDALLEIAAITLKMDEQGWLVAARLWWRITRLSITALRWPPPSAPG